MNKYSTVLQQDMSDCGPACILTVFNQYGLNVPLSRIRDVSGTNNYGTTLCGMVDCLEHFGFTAKGVKSRKEGLFNKFPLPAIANVIIEENVSHFIVIHEITRERIVISDPRSGLKKCSVEEFMNMWTGILILALPGESFEAKDMTHGKLIQLKNIFISLRWYIAGIFAVSAVYLVLGIMSSYYYKQIMDDLLPGKIPRMLAVFSAGTIFLYLIRAVLSYLRSCLVINFGQKIDNTISLGYYKHILNLPMRFFVTHKNGEILSRFLDSSKVREAISGAALAFLVDSVMLVAGGFILFRISRLLFGVTVLIVSLYIVMAMIMYKPMKKVNQVNMENSSSLNSSIMESIEGIETVKIFNAADYTFRNTEEKFRSFLRSSKKQGYLSNLSSSVSAFISSAGVILILWCGVVQISKGNITLGELLTFNALVEYFIDPIKNMINLYPSVQSAIVASDRLWEILDIECERNTLSSKAEMSLDGDIVIDDLTFSYGKGSPILKNVSLSIRRGQKIALVGESGSGKTTIARLLLKLYECGDNMIKINDKDINSISTELLRDRVAYISQETFLFSESVYNNLIFGKNDADEESVLKAAKFSQADDFIMKLPLAYSTRLGEKGVNISGGQKQCIAIARALLKDPDILIMDEATSNLDNITEKAVENAINNQDITTIIIAHRLSTIKNCDVIYVMDNGRIVESGNHLQLLKQRGRYYDLWCSQF